jgi:hypothetical protein
MTTQETEKIRDSLWTEIRQLVLDDGPVPKMVDEQMAASEIDADEREALVATLIAARCAEIAAMSKGPFRGMPVAIVLGSWAGSTFFAEQEGR